MVYSWWAEVATIFEAFVEDMKPLLTQLRRGRIEPDDRLRAAIRRAAIVAYYVPPGREPRRPSRRTLPRPMNRPETLRLGRPRRNRTSAGGQRVGGRAVHIAGAADGNNWEQNAR
jgi:hypothetical protein